MRPINRRTFLSSTSAVAIACSTGAGRVRAAEERRDGVTFGFGTYGMKSLTTEDAIQTLAEIGFDAVEVTAFPDWDAAPAQMSTERRKTVKKLLGDVGLQLTAVMAHLRPVADDAEHAGYLDELQRVIELGRDLTADETPVVQTVLGGGKWDDKKSLFVRRLADWAKIAEREQAVVCIKPHRGGAMSKPAEAAWIISQLGDTPWLRMVYDYSHYAFRDMTIDETVKIALPITAHIAIKDTIRTASGTTFVLPGESGNIDYAELISLFYTGGYRGDICCEVSGAVWGQPGYDPLAAAKTCYRNIAPIFEQAKIPRRSKA